MGINNNDSIGDVLGSDDAGGYGLGSGAWEAPVAPPAPVSDDSESCPSNIPSHQIDVRCLDPPSDPYGGLGCNAGGVATCRFCGFGPYVGIICKSQLPPPADVTGKGSGKDFNAPSVAAPSPPAFHTRRLLEGPVGGGACGGLNAMCGRLVSQLVQTTNDTTFSAHVTRCETTAVDIALDGLPRHQSAVQTLLDRSMHGKGAPELVDVFGTAGELRSWQKDWRVEAAPSPPPPSPPLPSSPALCSDVPEATCAGLDETCIHDARCLDIPSDPHGGLGCGAGGVVACRFCEFGTYASVPCRGVAASPVLETSAESLAVSTEGAGSLAAVVCAVVGVSGGLALALAVYRLRRPRGKGKQVARESARIPEQSPATPLDGLEHTKRLGGGASKRLGPFDEQACSKMGTTQREWKRKLRQADRDSELANLQRSTVRPMQAENVSTSPSVPATSPTTPAATNPSHDTPAAAAPHKRHSCRRNVPDVLPSRLPSPNTNCVPYIRPARLPSPDRAGMLHIAPEKLPAPLGGESKAVSLVGAAMNRDSFAAAYDTVADDVDGDGLVETCPPRHQPLAAAMERSSFIEAYGTECLPAANCGALETAMQRASFAKAYRAAPPDSGPLSISEGGRSGHMEPPCAHKCAHSCPAMRWREAAPHLSSSRFDHLPRLGTEPSAATPPPSSTQTVATKWAAIRNGVLRGSQSPPPVRNVGCSDGRSMAETSRRRVQI
jgi:hypothetical protein